MKRASSGYHQQLLQLWCVNMKARLRGKIHLLFLIGTMKNRLAMPCSLDERLIGITKVLPELLCSCYRTSKTQINIKINTIIYRNATISLLWMLDTFHNVVCLLWDVEVLSGIVTHPFTEEQTHDGFKYCHSDMKCYGWPKCMYWALSCISIWFLEKTGWQS